MKGLGEWVTKVIYCTVEILPNRDHLEEAFLLITFWIEEQRKVLLEIGLRARMAILWSQCCMWPLITLKYSPTPSVWKEWPCLM